MPEGLLSAGSPRIASLPQWGRLIGGGFAEIDEEVAAVLAFVISHTTFLASLEMTMRGLVSLGVLAFQSPATSHLSPLPNLALPVFPLVKYK